MPAAAIRYFDRYTGREAQESIYGERWLRWVYGSPLGRLALHALVKRALFSRWYGRRMDAPDSRRRIAPFIREYGLDPSEFADPPTAFRNFNEFFYRRLRPEARPVDPSPDAVVFPADGRHLGFPDLSAAEAFFVKGQRFDPRAFLADTAGAERLARGPAVFSRLCPTDYHLFHFPVDGTPSAPRLVPGPLFSVNPFALRGRLSILWENRRWLTEIDSPGLGRVLMAEIGATNVGSAVHTFTPGRPVTKGTEKGYFRFGGSAVLTLFEPGSITLAPDLLENSARQRELYAHVGDRMAMRRAVAGPSRGTSSGSGGSGGSGD